VSAERTTASTATFEVRVCAGSGCVANGSLRIAERFEAAIAEKGLSDSVRVIKTGCHGLCAQGPVVVVGEDGVFYPAVDVHAADRIIDSVLDGRKPVESLLFRESEDDPPIALYHDVPFNARQQRIVLRHCGIIDPEDIDSAIDAGDYAALRMVLETMTPEQVIETVRASGLRGRGGAGFLTGLKWQLARDAEGDLKYMCCNADEGDPGAFMDRAVLEGDPHAVLEGMAIAAYAIGAREGYVYVRAEYPLAVKRLRQAIADAEARGLLGNDIMGSGFDYRVGIREGAGAFVCGEETALIASVEGHRGMPRPRPPFPTTAGLWARPTCINNVETLANIAWIVQHGADAYNSIGTGNSRGTKVFALTGRVRHTGLVEVPMGLTVTEMVEEIGGGSVSARPIKAVQIGGPSGGCIPASLFDTPIEYDALASVGAVVGSGGLVVVDESTCMVEFARYFLAFTQEESCGKCVPCRIGTKRMLEIVTRITEGKGEPEDIETLERLGNAVRSTSLCALGGTAPNPVLTTLKYFREEYEEHIHDKKCRACACAALSNYVVVAAACKGCGVCKKNCPVGAISGAIKELHTIDPDKCVKCGICEAKCPFDAIIKV
jgi:NADH:ubiquinone oxidoreductase subunit F (NADH-binding)/(2Fe-2S) ferredoxin